MNAPMVPVTFGTVQNTLLGAYHPPTPQAECTMRSIGVVLCNPVGWEAIASQRSYRFLAEKLANQGYPVLRFDYAGTGDSAGDELQAGLVAAWLDSVKSACDELKRLAGIKRISLFGTHLGATLACAATVEHPLPVDSLVLWAPFLSGRNYLRQVRAYRLLNAPDSTQPSDGGEEAAGFYLTPSTVEELSRLELATSHTPNVRAALILARDEQSPEPKLVKALATKGADVELLRIDGYAPMMQEPRKSVTPTLVFEAVENFLKRVHPELTTPSATYVPPAAPLLEVDADVVERPMFLGPGEQMFGILTEPRTPPATQHPTVLWLNTASDHRIGPHRQYVSLARQLAKLGIFSLRFDPRGVGDATANIDPEVAHAYSEPRLQDVRDAIAWLSARGAREFACVGLCSAAYVAFHTARTDPRVVSEVLINPQTFTWREGDSLELSVRRSFRSNRFYQQRLRDKATWMRLLRGEVNIRGVVRTVSLRLAERALRPVKQWVSGDTSKELNVERAFRSVFRRGGRALVVFDENDGGLDTFESALGAEGSALKRCPEFHLELVKGADHTFSQRWMKEWLSQRVIEHLTAPTARA